MFNFQFHQSQLSMFLKCERQFFFRYIEGLVEPPKGALTLGSSVDDAVTHDLQAKIYTGELAKESDVLDVFSTSFDNRAQETAWEDEDPGETKDLGIKLVKLHHEVAAPQIDPETVQEEFLIETNEGYSLAGTMDITTKDGAIRDTKTSKMKYDPDTVDTSIQASMYSFAYKVKKGKEPKNFTFDVLTKTKIPAYQTVSGSVSGGQINRMFEMIKIMKSRIERGEFNYAPEGQWYCSKKWCGYWSKCKGRK